MGTTIFLIIALLVLAAALGVEVGIASWSIYRAGKYQRQKNAAECRAEHTSEKFRLLDKYATDISWLLKFLYNRYDRFADIDKEIEEGIKDVAEDTPVAEADDKYQELKRALKLVRTTVRAAEKIEVFVGTIATQIHSITRELDAEDEDEDEDENEDKEEAKAPEVTADPS